MKGVNLWGYNVPLAGFLIWLVYAILYFIALSLAIVISPILVLMANTRGELPPWVSWFAPIANCLDGDKTHPAIKPHWLKKIPDEYRLYVTRLLFLYRYPLQGFTVDVLGIEKDPKDKPELSPNPFNQMGKYKKDYWMVYIGRDRLVKRIPFTIHIGWNLRTETTTRYQFVFFVSRQRMA